MSPELWWGVFGGTWVSCGGERPRLSPQNRRVLGLLLVDPGRATSGARLVQPAEDASPEQVANMARVAVSRLRSALAPIGAAAAVVTTPNGYALEVEPGAVDHVRFSRLVREAESTEWPADALALVDRALALWTGRPFGDLADDIDVSGLAMALEEERRAAIDRRCLLAVETGVTPTVIAELESAVADDPYRERRWQALMLAHYRVGDQRSATDTYERARRRLRDDLGVAPGPELARLLRGILDHDPELEWRPVRSQRRPAGATAVGRPTTVIGRDDEIADVLDLLDRRRCVVVTGYGGMGKTALATEVAVRDGGASWVVPVIEGGGERVAATVADVMGMSSHEPDVVPRIARHLRDTGGLLVLDSCELADGAVEALVGELLGEAPTARFLLTSRVELGVPGAVTFTLGPLPTGTADEPGPAALLAADAALVRRSQLRERWDVVSGICARADGVPLALELLGAAHVDGAPAEVVADGSVGLGDAVTVALDSLPGEARYLVNVLRVLPLPVGLRFLGELADLGAAAVHRGLGPAVRAGLVVSTSTREAGTRVRLLDPVRDHLEVEPSLEAVVVKDLHRAFTDLARSAEPSMIDGIDAELAVVLDAEHELGLWLLDQLDPETALELACDLVPVWRARSRHADGKQVLERLEPVAGTAPDGLRARYWARRAHMSPSLAERALLVDRLREAVALATELGDDELRKRAGAELAIGLGWSGALAEAVGMMEELRASLTPEEVWADLTMRQLLTMGRALAGDPGGAAAAMLGHADEHAGIGHPGEVASCLYTAAAMARLAGDTDLLDEILDRARSVPVDRFSAYPMAGLAFERAVRAVASGDPAAGHLLWEAYGLLEAHGEQRGAATCRRELGTWRLRHGDPGGRTDLAFAALDLLEVDPPAAAIAAARLVLDGDDLSAAQRSVLTAGALRLVDSDVGLPLDPSERAEVAALPGSGAVDPDEVGDDRIRAVLSSLASAPPEEEPPPRGDGQ